MIIPFNLNPDSNVPEHIKDWNRVKILKQIDDFRWTISRQYNFDPTPEFLLLLKFCLICEMAQPQYDVDGNVVSINEDALQFDVSKDEIIAELENVAKILKENAINASGAKISVDCSVWSYGKYQADKLFYPHLQVMPGLYTIFGRPALQVSNYEKPVYENILFKPIPFLPKENYISFGYRADNVLGVASKYLTRSGMTSGMTYDTNIVNETHPRWPKLFTLVKTVYHAVMSGMKGFDEAEGRYFSKMPITGLGLYGHGIVSSGSLWDITARLSYQILYYKHTWEYIPQPAGYPIKLKLSVHRGDVGINSYNFCNPDTGNTIKNSVRMYAGYVPNVCKVCKFTDEFNVSTYLGVTDFDFIVNANPTLEGTNTAIKLTDFMGFSPIIAKQIFEGNFKASNGIMYSDASKFYDLEFVRYDDETLALIDELEYKQVSIQQLRHEITVEKRFTDVYAQVSYAGRTNIPVICSYYTDDAGVKSQFIHPVKGVWYRGVTYLYELIYDAMVLYKKIDVRISNLLNDRQIRNDMAYNDAYQKFLRGEAALSGPEAAAALEEKIRTGVFTFINGHQVWRPYTPEELKVIAELQRQLNANKAIIEMNARIEAENRAAQEAADQKAIALNAEYQRLADQKVIDEMAAERAILDAEVNARNEKLKNMIASITPPNIEEVKVIADQQGISLSDAVVAWMNSNPYYFYNENTRNAVEKLLAHVRNSEGLIATRVLTNALIDEQITATFEETFNIK